MDYIYLALEPGYGYSDPPVIRCAYTKKYNLENFLRKEFAEKTTLSHLTCYRIRGGNVTQIDPYEVVKVDPGEL